MREKRQRRLNARIGSNPTIVSNWLKILKDQCDYLYWDGAHGAPKFFAFNLHRFVSDVPFRTKIVDELIRHAKGFQQVWWALRIEVASGCLDKNY